MLMDGQPAVAFAVCTEYKTIARKGERLHVLSRTNCVRDRLAGFYFWDDRSSLASALTVTATGPVHWDIIDAWSARETTAAMRKHGQK
jgi:hypothetical protein